jgi:hypothetical protein
VDAFTISTSHISAAAGSCTKKDGTYVCIVENNITTKCIFIAGFAISNNHRDVYPPN